MTTGDLVDAGAASWDCSPSFCAPLAGDTAHPLRAALTGTGRTPPGRRWSWRCGIMVGVGTGAGWLDRGRELLAQGAWSDAHRLFADGLHRVVGTAEEGAAAEGLAAAAWELEDGDDVFACRERAYRCYRNSGDERGAGRMAAWLGLDAVHFRSEPAVAQGWFSRAHRILDELDEGAEQGLLALLEGIVALRVERDTPAAIRCADTALAVGRRLGSPDLEVQALALRGLALVGQGRVAEGMALLGEAAADALAGKVEDPGSMWIPCCFLMWGCEQVRDWDRAGQWCARVRDLCEQADWMGNSAYALCRSHYGAVLLFRGEWAAAEHELRRAADDLARQRPWFVADAQARLGELCRRQGAGEEAEKLFEQARRVPAARVGWAELCLDRGQPAEAVEVLQRLLDRLAPEAALERATALEAGVRAGVAAGHVEAWAWAVTELSEIAERVGTDAVIGSAQWARGVHIAASGGDAIASLELAVESFERAGGPYDAARARLDLASAFVSQGRIATASEEARLACDTFAALGAPLDARRAEDLLAGATGNVSTCDGLTFRQTEILRLLASGLTNRDIAERLVLSEHTVKRHVANILTRLGLPTRAAAAAHASRADLL
jgi:DNA-binding CsgD family transcriptional regulator